MRPRRVTALALALLMVLVWVCGRPAQVHAASPQPRDAARPNQLSLGWTPRIVLRRDQIASPRLYLGPAWGAGVLRYDRTKGANAQRIELDFAKATLRSQPDFDYLDWPDAEPATTEGSPLTYVRLKYAYLRELPLKSEQIALRLGPGLDFDIQQLDWVHHPFALGGYLGAFALDTRLELELRPRAAHRVRASASIPVLAWVTRSPYAINDDASIYANRDHNGFKTFFRYLASGQLQSWNRFAALRLDLRYDYRFHDHLALSTGLHLRVLANSVPRPVLAQEYGGSIALTALF